jgi:ribosome biogenesis GTPase A
MSLINKFAAHNKERNTIVGIVGYPNTGKASLINLFSKKSASPITEKSSSLKNYTEVFIK